jgi:hypothetical protein
MIDPITLAVKGERLWGVPGLSRQQIMPTVFHLHRYLLSGDTGKTITGVTGMMLLVAVLLGVVLWWPKLKLRALKQSVRIAHGGSWSRFIYTPRAGDLRGARAGDHRVFGLVSEPAEMGHADHRQRGRVSPAAKHQSDTPPPGVHAITPAQAMTAAQQQFPGALVTRVSLPRKPGDAYEVRLRQEGEVRADSGATRLWLDAYTGRPLGVRDPHDARRRHIDQLAVPAAYRRGVRRVGRAFITVFGLVPLVFALTGVLIWWKRRSGHRRHLAREKERSAPAAPERREAIARTTRAGKSGPFHVRADRAKIRAQISRLSINRVAPAWRPSAPPAARRPRIPRGSAACRLSACGSTHSPASSHGPEAPAHRPPRPAGPHAVAQHGVAHFVQRLVEHRRLGAFGLAR